jgi:hypothetical protein
MLEGRFLVDWNDTNHISTPPSVMHNATCTAMQSRACVHSKGNTAHQPKEMEERIQLLGTDCDDEGKLSIFLSKFSTTCVF